MPPGYGKKKKKLIDIGFADGFQRNGNYVSGRFHPVVSGLRTLDVEGSSSSINLHQKYIHTRLCTRAVLRCFNIMVFTVRLVVSR